MKTKIYTVTYGEDVFCRATHSFEAAHDGEAIAIALAHSWHRTPTDPSAAGHGLHRAARCGPRSVLRFGFDADRRARLRAAFHWHRA